VILTDSVKKGEGQKGQGAAGKFASWLSGGWTSLILTILAFAKTVNLQHSSYNLTDASPGDKNEMSANTILNGDNDRRSTRK